MMKLTKQTEQILRRGCRSLLGGRVGRMTATTNRCSSSVVMTTSSNASSAASSRDGIILATTMLGGMYLLSSTSAVGPTMNHCQVPCGIFDDPAIVNELIQASTTIRKAMVQSDKLHDTTHGTNLLSVNQVVRWINTKEEHCDKIISAVSDYLLCQRVKRVNFSSESDYLQALKLHHIVMQAAMKAKQTMDTSACDALDHAIDDLSKMYTK